MSVIRFSAQEIKALELAAAALTNFSPSPFPALYVANADAESRTYHGRPLTDGERQELLSEYACTAEVAGAKEAMRAADTLDALHLLHYNCYSNGGTYTVDKGTEAQRRAVVAGVLVECLAAPATGSAARLLKLAEFAYVARLQDGPAPDYAYRLQFFTSDERQKPYQGQDAELNALSAQHHASIFADGQTHHGFAFAWRIHDLISAHETAELDREIYQRAAALGIVPPLSSQAGQA